MDLKYDFLFKILLIGTSGVGKSSLMLRFSNDNDPSQSITPYVDYIGVDFKFRNIEVDGHKVRLQIWDFPYAHRCNIHMPNYYCRGAHGVFMVFDISSSSSFLDIYSWFEKIEQQINDAVCKILIGNKCDLEAKREVSTETGKALAIEFCMQYIEVSAQTMERVDAALVAMAREILSRCES